MENILRTICMFKLAVDDSPLQMERKYRHITDRNTCSRLHDIYKVLGQKVCIRMFEML